jgi:hypothetical protein
MRELLDIREKLNDKNIFAETIKMKIDAYDRMMSLLAQLDFLIENRFNDEIPEEENEGI